MDPVRNPYSPGAGRKPAALVGRDDALGAWETSLQCAQIGRTDQPVVLYGLRGVGKTVLLSEFRRQAAKKDWIVAQVEAGTDKSLRELLGEPSTPHCRISRGLAPAEGFSRVSRPP
jgi:Cdc6-like AAA superfamily ATPase